MEHKRLAEELLLNHPELGVSGVKVDREHQRVEVLAKQPGETLVRWYGFVWICKDLYAMWLLKKHPYCPSIFPGSEEGYPSCYDISRVASRSGAEGAAHRQLSGVGHVMRLVRCSPRVTDRESAWDHQCVCEPAGPKPQGEG